MGVLLAAAAAAAPAAASGIASALSGNKQRAWSAREAAKNRTWQEYMAKTRYQRTMADMKASGLNPILAYQQGGGSVPSGAQGQNADRDLGKAVTSGLEAFQKGIESKKLRLETLNAETRRRLDESLIIKANQDALSSQSNAAEADSRTHLNKLQIPKSQAHHDLWNVREWGPPAIRKIYKKTKKGAPNRNARKHQKIIGGY